MKIWQVVFFVLVASVSLSQAAGKQKRFEFEIAFDDIVSPQVVEAAARAQQPLIPLPQPAKGPFVPEPPAAKEQTTPLNMALSAATAYVVNSGDYDGIFNAQKVGNLPRPDVSACENFPYSPTGTLASILTSGVLRVGWFEASPHAFSLGGRGPFGYDVDFVKRVGEQIGRHYNRPLNVTFVPISVTPSTLFVDVAAQLGVGYDVAIELTDLASRRSSVNFACPYNTADFLMVRGPKDITMSLKTIHEMNNPNVTVAALGSGTPTGSEARRLLPFANFVSNLQTTEDVTNAVKNGVAHVGLDVGILLRDFVGQNPGSGVSVIPLPPSTFSTPAHFALASSK